MQDNRRPMPPASPPPSGRRPRCLGGVASAAVLALAACGGDERAAVARLTVTGGGVDAGLPRTDAGIRADEYRFRASGLRPGRQQLQFSNTGREPHHVLLAPIRDGATLDDARRFFAGRPFRSPPVDVENVEETAVLEGGQAQTTELDLRRGRYALLCFVADRSGGPQHTEKGMVQETLVR